ncbi:cysteine hydrolase family protein [Lacticaseibacillus hulanensis]|uniref:cysteine hydrolase family protein n=1 Tax=Lacticaseibacillus hulanensis TaxID=2493111 RepID=UPI000FD9001B|nr:isochorismatase family cysteine hydrolase [Lacticaseibacillus hulanensis]
MAEALIIVDYTNDFVADKGALTAGKPAQEVDTRITELATEFAARGDFVFLPTDIHVAGDPYHPETKLFPPHNQENTWGRLYYGQLAKWYAAHDDDSNVFAFPKRRYSSFAGTPLDQWLRERRITSVHIVGVCTDICVLHTAIDAYNLGYDITIHADACATFNPDGAKWSLDHFKNTLGATVVSGK